MKTIILLIVIMCLSLATMVAQEGSMTSEGLANLDAEWEKALLDSDVDRLDVLLADDFIWVHNHASMIDSKASLLKRASDPKQGATGNTRSRTSRDVEVIVKGATWIVTGFTVVDRGPTPTTYHFMRTYIEIEGKGYLLANHTMSLPEEGTK